MSICIAEENPSLWDGRYGRTVGNKASTLSIKWHEGEWWPVCTLESDEYSFICPVVNCAAARKLAGAVNNAKAALCGSEGGAFTINEYKQIIVPSNYGDGQRMYVGEVKGTLEFSHPMTEEIFTFDNNTGLKCGDEWEKPYLGTQFILSPDGYISTVISRGDEEERVYAPVNDGSLIKKIRDIRGSGGGRFIVNHHGIALTKKQFSDGDWRSVYVGMIDYKKWFEKERVR